MQAKVNELSIIDTAIDLSLRGFSVIPIRPADKKPLVSWKQFQTRIASESEIEGWFEKWPDANLAIVTGKISGLVVVDADGEIGRRWVSEHLPSTSVYAKTGRDGGYHCYFKYPDEADIPSKNGFQPKVDIKADGGYVICPPSIHASGKQYKWLFRDELNDWYDLTELNPYIMPKHGNLSGINWSKYNVLSENDNFGGAEEGCRNQKLASLVGKMIRAGAGGNEIFEWALAWNNINKPPLPVDEIKSTCRSIWNLAHKEHEIQLIPEQPCSTDVKLRGIQTDVFPSECLQPGGLLSDIIEYTQISNAACKPLFALAGAISLVGHLVGQRVQTETGLGTNMYCVSIGYSGAGKNAPHTAISQLIAHSDARISMCPTDTTSGSALLRWLTTQDHQRALYMFDEFGMLLKGTRNQTNSLADLPKILTRMFSSINRAEVKSYADPKNNITIPWHHLSVYGSSTPSEFWGNLSEGDTTSGFLARLLIFQVLDDPIRPKHNQVQAMPIELLKKINALWTIQPPINKDRGDIAQVPLPFIVKRSKDAEKYLDSWSEKYWNLACENKKNTAQCSIYNRAAEHAAKLALIRESGIKLGKIIESEVSRESIVWACSVVDSCINTMIRGIEENISTSKFHELKQRYLKIISSGDEISWRTISQKMRESVKIINELTLTLLHEGTIETREVLNKNGSKTRFVKKIGD